MSLSPLARRRRGVVLVVVLFFALLLASTVATFLRKATIDAMIVHNRDARAQAEALARGGVRLATALLLEDKYRETQEGGLALNYDGELWARASGTEIPFDDGSSLTLRIEDAGEKLDLNAAIAFDESGNASDVSVALLHELLNKVIDEIPVPPAEKVYDVDELVANLIDFVDPDDVRQRGGAEDDVYQKKQPPYRAPNRPLLSVGELRRVDGFDGKLVDALEPYVTVYPYAGPGGINPNTAPPHVLALLFFDDGVDLRLAPEDTIREILDIRQQGGLICAEDQSDEACTSIRQIVQNAIFPEPSFTSDVFVVTAEARVGEIQYRVEAVLDRREGAKPLLLSWRVL